MNQYTSEDYDQIELFIQGNLTGEDLSTFKSRIASDEAFAKEVALHREVQKVILDGKTEDFKSSLQQVESTYFTGNIKSVELNPWYIRQWYWIAASVTILLVGGVYLFYEQWGTPKTTDELFISYYQPYEVRTLRSVTSDVPLPTPDDPKQDLLDESFSAYHDGKFDKAFSTLEEAIKSNPENMIAQFYRGVVAIQLEDHLTAIAAFNKVVDHGDNLLIVQAKWYLSLVYMKQNKVQLTQKLLDEIILQSEDYQDLAKSLKKELEQID